MKKWKQKLLDKLYKCCGKEAHTMHLQQLIFVSFLFLIKPLVLDRYNTTQFHMIVIDYIIVSTTQWTLGVALIIEENYIIV